MKKALVISPTGEATLIEFTAKTGLSQFQAAVGGWVEALDLYNVTLWINEEGVFLDLPANDRVTQQWGFPIRGTVVLTGGATETGQTRGLNAWQVENYPRILSA